MIRTASQQACRTAALMVGALLAATLLSATLLTAQTGADHDAPLGASVAPSNGPDAISVDVLRHPIPEKARRMLQRALDAMNSGNDETARQWLLETLAKYPDSAVYVQSFLGVIYVRTFRFTDAVNSFEQAAALLPHDSMTHYNFGLSLACAGDYERSEREVRRALELDPKNISAQTLLSVLQHRNQPAAERREATHAVSETEISLRGKGHSGD
jgi:Tfp pilus assembly protein PilF